ncbi:MAG: bifunctional riboflavin kinase/FAD synthetase [Aquificaceae bacterium]|nr:MAG: bifunctional riboflavin kinase/FAD synthetase [Aquificaceae bacterium]
MKLTRGLKHHGTTTHGCVASIGNFDGLHLGHQKLLSHLHEKSKQLNLPSTIISFEPLPAEFFIPTPPARIYPLRDKIRLLNQFKVDHYLCLRFNKAFSSMSPEDFVQTILFDYLQVKYLVVGDDFRFGKQRKGDFKLLQAMGAKVGMEVRNTPTCVLDNERVSSTLIRKKLSTGDIESSVKLLGKPYQLSGRVRHGDKRGRTIGFPTLNLRLPDFIAPAKGVYAVRINGLSGKTFNGVANIGTRPTVSGKEVRLETHVFDYDGNAYGKHVCIQLDKFLRPEQRFDSFDDLKAQILKDAEIAKQYYA